MSTNILCYSFQQSDCDFVCACDCTGIIQESDNNFVCDCAWILQSRDSYFVCGFMCAWILQGSDSYVAWFSVGLLQGSRLDSTHNTKHQPESVIRGKSMYAGLPASSIID